MKKEVLRVQCAPENTEMNLSGCIRLYQGETIGIVGRNNSGKSVFMGTATGEWPNTSNEVKINERVKKIQNITDARKNGIFLIKGKSSLIEQFDRKSSFKLNYAFIHKKMSYSKYRKKCKRVLELLAVSSEETKLIQDYSFHERILLEIAQALVCDAKILVFDNVISMLSESTFRDFTELFEVLHDLEVSIILIESQFERIQFLTDRLYVFCDQKVAAELYASEMDAHLVHNLMDGEKMNDESQKRLVRDGDERIKMVTFQNVCSSDHVIQGLNFSLYVNEVLGILNQNLHSGKALIDLLSGKTEVVSGNMITRHYLSEKNILKNQEISVIAEDDSFCSNLTIGQNISLSAMRKLSYGSVIKNEGELRYLEQSMKDDYFSNIGEPVYFDQKVPDSVLIRKKMALCRAIASGAKIIVHENPFMRMDYFEKNIYIDDIVKTQKKGISQIVISYQRDYLERVCSRILVLEKGNISD